VVLNDAETLAAQAKLEALKKGFGEESLKAKAADDAENGTSAPAAAPAPTLKGSSANKVSADTNRSIAAEKGPDAWRCGWCSPEGSICGVWPGAAASASGGGAVARVGRRADGTGRGGEARKRIRHVGFGR
jgi:hypothetical protein